MKKTTRTLQAVALTVVGLLTLWQGMALAGDVPAPPPAPTSDAPSAPEAPAEPESGSTSSSAPEPASSAPSAPQTATLQAEAPTDDGDSPGHETEDPSGSPHASGEVADATIGGQLDVVAGSTNAQIDDTDSDDTSSDVTVLAIGGEEIVGAHAESDGTTEDSQGAQIACDPSGGAICVGLLFAEATATEDDESSDASASTSLLFVCLGGSNTDPSNSEECTDAPVSAGVSEASSTIHKDKSSGESSADQETRLANACVGGEDPLTGTCSGLGAEAIESESHSSIEDTNQNGTTEDDTGTTSRQSCVVVVQAGGEDAIPLCAGDGEEGQDLSIPQECPDPSLICIFLNQGEAFVFVGGAGSSQEAVHVALPGPLGELIFAHLGTAETLVEGQVAEECPPGTVGTPPDCVRGGNGPPEPPEDGNGVLPRGGPPTLAFTGLGALPLLALSLILGAAGGSVLTWDRRRRDTR